MYAIRSYYVRQITDFEERYIPFVSFFNVRKGEMSMGLLNDKAVSVLKKSDIKNSDQLGLSDYAEALATFIKECETPITIGIQGDWGIGKTSLLNMIDTCLGDKSFRKIWFNTWHYSLFEQDKFLGITVIQALLDEIATRFRNNFV